MLEAHSLLGPRTQCTARTLSGTASTAIGTVDPTTAGELLTSGSVLCYSLVVDVNKKNPVKLTVIWKQPLLLYSQSGALWFLRISSCRLTVPPLVFVFCFFPNDLQLNFFIFTPGDSHCINDKLISPAKAKHLLEIEMSYAVVERRCYGARRKVWHPIKIPGVLARRTLSYSIKPLKQPPEGRRAVSHLNLSTAPAAAGGQDLEWQTGRRQGQMISDTLWNNSGLCPKNAKQKKRNTCFLCLANCSFGRLDYFQQTTIKNLKKRSRLLFDI